MLKSDELMDTVMDDIVDLSSPSGSTSSQPPEVLPTTFSFLTPSRRRKPGYQTAPLLSSSAPPGRGFNHELLEDWPRSMSGCSVTKQDWQLMSYIMRPRVTFSNKSDMQLFYPDPYYIRTKSYNKQDRVLATKDAFSKAIEIRQLLMLTSSSERSIKAKIKFLLDTHVILPEEICGIEHLIMCKSLSQLHQERKVHVREVLLEQQRIKSLIAMDSSSTMKCNNDGNECSLAKFSASMSLQSAHIARFRASAA